MSKMQRTKGQAFERLIARELRKVLGIRARRGIQSRSGGEIPDIDLDTGAYWIECRHRKKPEPLSLMKNTREVAKKKGCIPIGVVKRDYEETFAMIDWLFFLELLKCWEKNKPSRIQE